MKTILVPVDFSESAYSALRYAYQLASANKSRIVLLNCYQIPVGSGNVMIDFEDILERESILGLQDFSDRIQTNFVATPVQIETESYYGVLADGVERLIKTHKVDMVVMGTRGASTFVKKLIGSNTSNLLRKIKTPILVVPEGAVWHGWEHTIFAADFLNADAGVIFNKFKKLINGMKVSIDVLHVIDKANASVKFEKIETEFIDASKANAIEFHYQPAENPVEGILNYAKGHECDVLVMVRRKHGFVEQLFNESATRKMALHSKNPVLLLQE